MRKAFWLIFIYSSLVSCVSNKKISLLEDQIKSLTDSLQVIKATINIVNKKGDYNTGKNLTYIGFNAGKYNSESENVFIGNFSGMASGRSRNSVFVGTHSGVNSKGYGNVAIGNYSGQNIKGKNNTIIGKSAANQKIGDNNVVIGTHAGTKLGYLKNKLIIESSDSKFPLVYGDFLNDSLVVNGSLKINGFLELKQLNKAPLNPKIGYIFFDKISNSIKYWNGVYWIEI